MFVGFVTLGGTLKFLHQTRHPTTRAPTAATGSPTFRAYGGDEAVMSNGTGSLTAFDAGNLTGVYQCSLSISSGDGYEKGSTYSVHVLATVASTVAAEIYTFTVV